MPSVKITDEDLKVKVREAIEARISLDRLSCNLRGQRIQIWEKRLRRIWLAEGGSLNQR